MRAGPVGAAAAAVPLIGHMHGEQPLSQTRLGGDEDDQLTGRRFAPCVVGVVTVASHHALTANPR